MAMRNKQIFAASVNVKPKGRILNAIYSIQYTCTKKVSFTIR